VEDNRHIGSEQFFSGESDSDSQPPAIVSPLTDYSSSNSSIFSSIFSSTPTSEKDYDSLSDFSADTFSDFGDVDDADIADFLLSSNLFDIQTK
jgi:hypothetical protein